MITLMVWRCPQLLVVSRPSSHGASDCPLLQERAKFRPTHHQRELPGFFVVWSANRLLAAGSYMLL